MRETLGWYENGVRFQDGSKLSDWEMIYQDDRWHWQYDTDEMTFAIYRHDDQFWKLYQVRFVGLGDTAYSYGYGGQACRMVEVEYLRRAWSTHSNMPMEAGQTQWIRTYEFDPQTMRVIRQGETNEKYGAPYTAIDKGKAA